MILPQRGDNSRFSERIKILQPGEKILTLLCYLTVGVNRVSNPELQIKFLETSGNSHENLSECQTNFKNALYNITR